MLDFNKLMQQIELIGLESLIDTDAQQEVLEKAEAAFHEAAGRGDELIERLQAEAPWVLWPVAIPLEPLAETYTIDNSDFNLTVVGTDGSQIMPSHHEVNTCFLLNIGLALISYGVKLPPRLESIPRLYHRPEELYPLVDRRRIHVDELYVSLERTLLELTTLTETAIAAKHERELPVVALFDGSLIPWSVERLSDEYQSAYMIKMTQQMERLEEAEIPLIGYLSHSRGSDLINCLRVSICPYEESNCRAHCGQLNEEDFPCSTIWPLNDRQLLGRLLPRKHRSAAFLSGATVLKALPGAQRICFAYLNVAEEIARLEFPRWLLKDEKLMELGVRAVLNQCKKGMGYPIALAEAHHLAVVRGADRDRFFELMTRHLVALGAPRVRQSPKESKKRMGFI